MVQGQGQRYLDWIKIVKCGVKSFTSEYFKELNGFTSIPEPDSSRPTQVRHISASTLRKRAIAKELGIMDSDEEEDVFAAALIVDYDYSNHDHRAKRRCEDSELESYLCYKSSGPHDKSTRVLDTVVAWYQLPVLSLGKTCVKHLQYTSNVSRVWTGLLRDQTSYH